MPLPAELERAFADLDRKIEDKHKTIKGGLDSLRTMVLGHYADVNKAVATLEREGRATARELSLTKQQVSNLRERVAKLEKATGTGP